MDLNNISKGKDLKAKSLMEVHLAVLFFGLAGLFGKLVSLPSMVIVFGRVAFASAFLFILLNVKKVSLKLESKRDYAHFIMLGAILAFHWYTFFLAIQLSTVAIGLLTFSTFPVFVAFIEPFFSKEKIRIKDLVTAVITFCGVALVMPGFEFENSMTQGALWGIASGFTFAILSILNRRFVSRYKSLVISFYQCSVATLVLLPFVAAIGVYPSIKDMILLCILGVVFTGISHTLFINGMKNVKAQTASIIASLEPVYGIIATVILIREIPSIREVVGGLIILVTAAYSTWKN